MRILVTGSRHWVTGDVIRGALTEALGTYSSLSLPVLVHGGARGADSIAGREWLKLTRSMALGPVEVHEADWDRHGKAAGMLRNAKMVGLGATVCLAFPIGESRGTRGCMRLAKDAGIPVIVYEGPHG